MIKTLQSLKHYKTYQNNNTKPISGLALLLKDALEFGALKQLVWYPVASQVRVYRTGGKVASSQIQPAGSR